MRAPLAAVTAGQFGLVTRAQARAAGLTDAAIRWRVQSGRWTQVHRGVYSTTPGRDDWLARAQAALLHLGMPSALSGPSAGYLWGLLPQPGAAIHLVVPVERRPDPMTGLVITRSRHAVERTHEWEWPHRIQLEHTVFDLAQGQALDRAVGLVAKACQSGRTTVRNLRQALVLRPNQTHYGTLFEVLEDVGGGVESSAERRYVRDVERAHGLPVGVRQDPGPGSTVRDNAYRDLLVIVEIDGRAGHGGWRAQQRDGRRDRRNAAGAWLTVRGFWPDVCGGQCAFALELEAIFRSRGWPGRARPCRAPACAVRRRPVEA